MRSKFTGLDVWKHEEETSLLKVLKAAVPVDLPATGKAITNKESGVQTTTLDIKLPDSVLPNTLYVRSFYPRLFNLLWQRKCSILLENPGISKSWLQLYIIYCLVNEKVSLGPDYLGKNSRPKVIIRQIGTSRCVFYFTQHDLAYISAGVPLLYMFKPVLI